MLRIAIGMFTTENALLGIIKTETRGQGRNQGGGGGKGVEWEKENNF